VHPATGEQLPEGETGEIVFTNLIGDTQPLLRYRSADVGRLIPSTPCECGSTITRIARIEGRSDDMIWYRGVNFFPSAVENIVRRHGELSPECRIVLDNGPRGLPVVTIQVEARADVDAGAPLQQRLRDALPGGLGVNPELQILAAGTLPRAQQAKAKLVLDRRAATPDHGSAHK
jgi:phenylacetate-CoA ligase